MIKVLVFRRKFLFVNLKYQNRLLHLAQVDVCNFDCLSDVAQLVEALRYKLEGRGFDSRWGHLNSSVT
jgi:hypothetical protein